ncbi:DUF2268 domain-containing protein [Flavobacterium sp. LS1R49]|uniref:DUF2268 domain-containing protein n=1 Tax=Flavobacterium shii TaxID=2987687 RepID=A0A9X2YVV2_9FLAO|nr:DUF2268 domain-containing protein [Flavobacterium shii]MCV9928684.1 DUF2268 domain-containing protein [Flavobacterium shii]
MRHFKIVLLLLLFSINSFGQTKSLTNYNSIADSLYKAKNYNLATNLYIKASQYADFPSRKAGALYNAACCLALQNKKDSAFIFVNKAVDFGYNDKDNITNDTDFNSLHGNSEWDNLIKRFKEEKTKSVNDNPAKVTFFTEDIHRFWKAYDLANKDSIHYKEIFKTYYFDKASIGMNDYFGSKVGSIDEFIKHIKSAPKFYHSIKKNTLKVDDYKKDFRKSFQNLKDIYPAAKFPDIYFVIGAFTSGGTVSKNGLLIGLNQASESDETPTDELSERQKTRLSKIKYLPNLLAHELIHFQQKTKRDTITLGYVIIEGMGDFIGELISGSTANPDLMNWAQGKEKVIWEKFTKDMYFNRYNNWIANSKQSSADNPPDQGYWIGYEICKAYYENAKDKKKAISEMLNIQDYRKFLAESGWEEKLSRMK